MNLERFVLFLGGALCIAAFFFPFVVLTIKPAVEVQGLSVEVSQTVSVPVSGFEMVRAGIDIWQQKESLSEYPGLSEAWAEAQKLLGAKQWGLLAGIGLVLLGPVLFGLYGLMYVLRSLFKRQYNNGIFPLLIYTGACWAFFFFAGKSLWVGNNFFSMAGLGYWLALGGMLAAAFSLFFEKSSAK